MLEVSSFGKFLVTEGDAVLNDDVLRSDMLKKLFVYILTHREHPITIQELSEALWQEDETDNPAGALKNLMYRLRNILKSVFGNRKYILTSTGAYSWNAEVEVSFDAEKFEDCCNRAKDAVKEEDIIQNYEEALEFYRGEFMEHILDRHWAVTLSTYYHSLFLTATKELAELYQRAERYQDMERICINGLRFDKVDEQIHCYYIMALIRQDKFELAMKNYEEAAKILYDALGVRNSGRLQEVQKELLKMNKGIAAEGMEYISEDMAEGGEPVGVYLCGYPVFREIYRLEVRKNGRLGEAEYVVLMTVEVNEGIRRDENEKMEKFLINQAMKQLEESLKQTLRIGDVAARYSDRQFVILLPTCTYESSVRVAKRILNNFYEKNKGKKVTVKTEYEQVTAAKSFLVK